MYVRSQGHARAVTLLQEHGALSSAQTIGAVHSAALHLAVRFGHHEVVNALLFPSRLARTATSRSEMSMAASSVASMSTTAGGGTSTFDQQQGSSGGGLGSSPLHQLMYEELRVGSVRQEHSTGYYDSARDQGHDDPPSAVTDVFAYQPIHLAVVAVAPTAAGPARVLGESDDRAGPTATAQSAQKRQLPPWERSARCLNAVVKAHVRAYESGPSVGVGGIDAGSQMWDALGHATFLAAEFGDFPRVQRLVVDGFALYVGWVPAWLVRGRWGEVAARLGGSVAESGGMTRVHTYVCVSGCAPIASERSLTRASSLRRALIQVYSAFSSVRVLRGRQLQHPWTASA